MSTACLRRMRFCDFAIIHASCKVLPTAQCRPSPWLSRPSRRSPIQKFINVGMKRYKIMSACMSALRDTWVLRGCGLYSSTHVHAGCGSCPPWRAVLWWRRAFPPQRVRRRLNRRRHGFADLAQIRRRVVHARAAEDHSDVSIRARVPFCDLGRLFERRATHHEYDCRFRRRRLFRRGIRVQDWVVVLPKLAFRARIQSVHQQRYMLRIYVVHALLEV